MPPRPTTDTPRRPPPDLSLREAEQLFARIFAGEAEPGDSECFRGQMLVEMAAMSMDDGLVLQDFHTGAWHDHNPTVAARFGPDMGADMPRAVNYVSALKPLLDRFGNEAALTVVVYTLDETTYSRELAPLAGHYPALPARTPVVVLRQPRGHAEVLQPGDRNGRLCQHRRVQRRCPVAADHPRPP